MREKLGVYMFRKEEVKEKGGGSIAKEWERKEKEGREREIYMVYEKGRIHN